MSISIVRDYMPGSQWIANLERLQAEVKAAASELASLREIAQKHQVDVAELRVAPMGIRWGEGLRPWRKRGYDFLIRSHGDLSKTSKSLLFLQPIVIPGKTNPYNDTQLHLLTEHFAVQMLADGELEKFPEYSHTGRHVIVSYLEDVGQKFRSWPRGAERPVLTAADKVTYAQVEQATRENIKAAEARHGVSDRRSLIASSDLG